MLTQEVNTRISRLGLAARTRRAKLAKSAERHVKAGFGAAASRLARVDVLAERLATAGREIADVAWRSSREIVGLHLALARATLAGTRQRFEQVASAKSLKNGLRGQLSGWPRRRDHSSEQIRRYRSGIRQSLVELKDGTRKTLSGLKSRAAAAAPKRRRRSRAKSRRAR